MFAKFIVLLFLLSPVVSFAQEDSLIKKILKKDLEKVEEQVICQIKLPTGTSYDYRNTGKEYEFSSESLFGNVFGEGLLNGNSKLNLFDTSTYRLTPNYLGLNEQDRRLAIGYSLSDNDEYLTLNFESIQFTANSLFEEYQPGLYEGFRERNIVSLEYTKKFNSSFYLLGGLQLEHYTNDTIIGEELQLEGQILSLRNSRRETYEHFDAFRKDQTILKVYGGAGFKKAMEFGQWKCTIGAEVVGGVNTEDFDRSEVQFRGGVTFDSQDWGGRDKDNPYLVMQLLTDIRSDFDDRHNEMAMFTVGTSVKVSDWFIRPYAGVAVYNESGENLFGFDEDPYFVFGFSLTRSKRRR